jgi:IS30 family transposase
MERHRQTVGYYDATGLTAPQRDELIVRLRRKGYSYRKIGKAVGMSPQGVLQALRRMADPAPLATAPSQVVRQGRDPRA